MKAKVFITVAAAAMALLSSCAEKIGEDAVARKINTKIEFIAPTSTKAGDPNFKIPVDGMYKVYFYIRIDGNIPGEEETNLKAGDYFPQTSAGKSMMGELNTGYVNANAEWRTNSKFPLYIYSKDGSAVQSIIVKEPTLEDLINADKNTKNDFSGYLEHKDELHFIWYICKRQDADQCWHIDGILTTKDRTNIADTDYGKEIIDNYNSKGLVADEGSAVNQGSVAFDIHQQEHNDWNEIKTSIHIRDTVDCNIFIPIPESVQAQADDVVIRAGVEYEYMTKEITINEQTFTVEFEVKHQADGINIHIGTAACADALKAAREAFGDGLTFEIHSYAVPEVSPADLWGYLKKTKCPTTEGETHIYGQVTSAYYPEAGISHEHFPNE